MVLMITAHEKYWRAVDALACSTGRIQERLANAGYHIAGMHVKGDLPEDLSEAHTVLIAALRRASGLEGTLKATAASLSDEEAGRYASQIVTSD